MAPSTVTVSLLDQPEHHRTCAHILSYIPVRKSATIDIVEDAHTGARPCTSHCASRAGLRAHASCPKAFPLAVEGEARDVPCVDGYAIVELT